MAADAKLRELEPTRYQLALTATIRAVYLNQRLPEAWKANEGAQTPDGKALAQWRDSYRIRMWLRTVPFRKHDEKLGELIQKAADYLAAEQGRLRAAWVQHHHTGAWDRLPPSAQQLGTLCFAMAAAKRTSRILLAHRPAMFGIKMLCGVEYRSLNTITGARVKLVEAGIAEVEVGQQWEAGRKLCRPTEFNLLPSAVREAVSKDTKGTMYVTGGAYTPEQLQQMDDFYGKRRRERDGQPDPDREFAWLLGEPQLAEEVVAP